MPIAGGGTIDVWGGNLVLLDGVVAATWRRRKAARARPIRSSSRSPRSGTCRRTERDRIDADAAQFIDHLDTPVDLQWKDAS